MGWWHDFCRVGARLGACGLWQMRVYGRENVPETGGLLLVSNHQSFLDPVYIGAALDRCVDFMARSSLFRIPAFRALIVSYNAFPIERDKRDVKGVKEAVRRLKAGRALVVFPEGTRTRDGRVARMKPGFRLLAERADVPIVPVLLEGAFGIWPRHRLLPGGGRLNILFGPPIRLRDAARTDVGETIRGKVLALRGTPHRRVETEKRNGE